MVAEKCMICGKKMYIGEAYSLYSDNKYGKPFLVGYVHRNCLDEKKEMKTDENKTN